MPPLIDETRFNEIRAAIDISLGQSNLPDEIIAKDIFLGKAERWVASHTDDTTGPAKNACIFYTAYLLWPSLPQLNKETIPTGESIEYVAFNKEAKLAWLLAQAEGFLSEVPPKAAPPVAVPRAPTAFTLAHGTRGR